MAATGVRFEMNAKMFTVGNLFAMNLSASKDQIEEIAMAAIQEARIEKVVVLSSPNRGTVDVVADWEPLRSP